MSRALNMKTVVLVSLFAVLAGAALVPARRLLAGTPALMISSFNSTRMPGSHLISRLPVPHALAAGSTQSLVWSNHMTYDPLDVKVGDTVRAPEWLDGHVMTLSFDV